MSTYALSLAERIEALSRCEVFRGVPMKDLHVLAEMMETEQVDAGEALFELGEPADRVFVIASGTVSVHILNQPEPVRTMGRGEVVGEYGMFTGSTRTAAVRAETKAALLSLDYGRFRAFLLQFPEAALVLLRGAVERLVAAERRAGGPAGQAPK